MSKQDDHSVRLMVRYSASAVLLMLPSILIVRFGVAPWFTPLTESLVDRQLRMGLRLLIYNILVWSIFFLTLFLVRRLGCFPPDRFPLYPSIGSRMTGHGTKAEQSAQDR